PLYIQNHTTPGFSSLLARHKGARRIAD
ncbi:hypothetical protein, partial [Salmonella enterica]